MDKYSFMLSALIFLAGCQANKPTGKCDFGLDYNAWGATILKIQDGKIYHSKAIDKGTISHEFDGVDVYLNGESLDKGQLKELQKQIKAFGFMALERGEYGATDNVRYYPYTIKVNMGCREKEVLYRSNPEFEKAPEAFQKLETFLFEFAGTVKSKSNR